MSLSDTLRKKINKEVLEAVESSVQPFTLFICQHMIELMILVMVFCYCAFPCSACFRYRGYRGYPAKLYFHLRDMILRPTSTWCPFCKIAGVKCLKDGTRRLQPAGISQLRVSPFLDTNQFCVIVIWPVKSETEPSANQVPIRTFLTYSLANSFACSMVLSHASLISMIHKH